MKKLFGGISMVAIMLVCLTGCGKGNTLKCTGNLDGTDTTMTATLNDGKVVKISAEGKETFDSEDEAKQNAAATNVFGSLGAESGITITAKANGKNVITTMTIDVAKVSESDLENSLGTKDLTKDAFVKAMKDQGLTCK